MVIMVLNENFRQMQPLKKYTFCQYERRFREIGNFEIHVRLIKENLYLLEKQKYYILFGFRHVGILTNVEKNSDSEYKKTIVLTGKMVENILSDRVVVGTLKYTGKSYGYVEEVVKKNLIESSDENRNINMTIERQTEDLLNKRCGSITKQITGGSVWDAVFEILEVEKIGCEIMPVLKPVHTVNGKQTNISEWIFNIISGADRTRGNDEGNNPVIFSQSLSNVSRTGYRRNTQQKKNVSYVAATGEGEERKWFIQYADESDTNVSGWDRSELWIDARDISDKNEDGEEIEETAYENLIEQRAKEKFAENTEQEEYTATISPRAIQYQFEKDYFLGDWVTVKDDELGIEIDVQITAITYSVLNSVSITDIEITKGETSVKTKGTMKDLKSVQEQNTNNIKYIENKLKNTQSGSGGSNEEIEKIISDVFSETKKYSVGDYVIYENVLYQLTAEKEAGVWDPSKVKSTIVSKELSKVNATSGELVTQVSEQQKKAENLQKQITSLSTYGSSETVIGTYGGKPLYRVIKNLGGNIQSSGTVQNKKFSLGIANIDKIVSFNAFFDKTTMRSRYLLPYINTSAQEIYTWVESVTASWVSIWTKADWSGYYLFAEITYTKTTD